MVKERSRRIRQEDIEFIYSNYGRMTVKEIAERLGLSQYQVNKAIYMLRKRGVDLPEKRGRSVYDEFVEELKRRKEDNLN